jgi:hypothetical protein
MENFAEKYKNFTNIDLLTIIREAAQYKPEALDAAKTELSNRNIGLEEMELVDQQFASVDTFNNQLHSMSSLPSRILAYMEPIKDEEGKLTPEGWLRIFIISQVVIGLWQAYHIIIGLIAAFSANTIFVNFTNQFLLLFSLMLIIASIFLLIRKSYWGWALVLGSTIIYLLSLLKKLYLYYIYSKDGYLRQFYSFSWQDGFWLAVQAGFLTFLLQPVIRDLFKVDKKIIINTIIVTISFLLLLYVVPKL